MISIFFDIYNKNIAIINKKESKKRYKFKKSNKKNNYYKII